MKISILFASLICIALCSPVRGEEAPALLTALQADAPPLFICYTPLELDPRDPSQQRNLTTTSIRKDLETLRGKFDGLILYGYHEATTPRIAAVAAELEFRAIFFGVWDIRSADEIDGAVTLANDFQEDGMITAVLLGNEGVNFGRYELADLPVAAARFKKRAKPGIAYGTSEPLVQYGNKELLSFGDFLAPNIHPVFDRPNLLAAEAAAWARGEAVKLAEKSGKAVLLKETGFPHGGKDIYSPKAQAEFWTAYLRPGLLEKTDKSFAYFGVGFEAFDLPWKAEASGLPIEAYWGLFDTERKPLPASETFSK